MLKSDVVENLKEPWQLVLFSAQARGIGKENKDVTSGPMA